VKPLSLSGVKPLDCELLLIDIQLSEGAFKSKQVAHVERFVRAFRFINFYILLFQKPVPVVFQFLLPNVCLWQKTD
jgi:hypothetical protein